tara:strand:+ start:126 stop:1013 length:888 start_codon:yes stop_codon:yes gene_type:complete
MASPYQTARISSNLSDLLQTSRLRGQEAQRNTGQKMSEMQDEFEKEIEELQRKAQKKAGKNKGLFKGLNILSSFLPLGSGAALKGLTGLAQGQQQKKGAEMLLDKNMKEKYGGTFLKSGMKNYWEQAEDSQLSSGDVLRGGIGAGMSGYASSKLFGGEEGLFNKMFKKPQDILETSADVGGVGIKAPDLLGDSTATEMWQGAGELGENSFGIGGARVQAPDLLSGNNIQGLGSSMGIKRDLISNPIGKIISGGQATPIKTLLEQLQSFGSTEGVNNEMQKNLMLPMLLQQLFGGQ